jgi:hypothetical protein
MEPKALANLNGMMVSSPVKGPRDPQTAPNTPMNRRDSVEWMRVTPENLDGEGEDGDEWDGGILTPVPVTPAPEAIARFAAGVMPETPYVETDADMSPTREMLVMQTCPPKPNAYAQMGGGILGEKKDSQVMMRLMAARRKSLQYAPKVGSPLSKTWSG